MQHTSLTLVGVAKRYGRRKPFVLSRIDAELEPGTIVHVQGGNGSGKSTLLRVIAGVSAGLFVLSLIVPWSPVLHAARVLETDPRHHFRADLLPWLAGMLGLGLAGAVTAVFAAGRE